jgi:Zn-dependent oligopeptidase
VQKFCFQPLCRQLSFGLLDMGWHGQDPTAITDVKAFSNNLQPQNYTLK